MSKIVLAVALLLTIGFTACKPEDVDPTIPSQFQYKGALKYENKSADRYDIFLDDTPYGDLYGGDTARYPDIPVGIHRVKAIQKSNIVGTPTLRQEQINVYRDSTVTFSFP
jgi:hypothetical protein